MVKTVSIVFLQSKDKMMRGTRRGCLRLKVRAVERKHNSMTFLVVVDSTLSAIVTQYCRL